MTATAAIITALIERELDHLSDRRVLNHVRSLLVPPVVQMRDWDYGGDDSYPCWIVLAHECSNTGIAYSESGFGPAHPWGLLFLKGAHMSMGTDASWYDRFLDAYFESRASADLPIWRVFKGRDFPGMPISDEGGYEETWAKVLRLREDFPGERFNCWQSVYGRSS